MNWYSADSEAKHLSVMYEIWYKLKYSWHLNENLPDMKERKHHLCRFRTFVWASLYTVHGQLFCIIHTACNANEIIHSLIPLARAECDNSLPSSGASSIPLCYILFPATLLHLLFFHPLAPHLAIYFLVYLSILLFQNSYIILFWEFYFLPFSVHAQTNVIYFTLLSLL